jgi:hypothetical protein
MPQCQFPVFCCFYVLEKLHWKYSRNWTKQKLKFLFFLIRDGVQSRGGGGPEGGHPTWRGPPPGRAGDWCGPLVHLLTLSFRLYILLDVKIILQAAYVVDTRSGKSRSSSRHPVGEGNHHQRPSSSPCLRPE